MFKSKYIHSIGFQQIRISHLGCFTPQDQMLTKEEILENWNMFVGSQATNYGEDLTRNHDELWAQLKRMGLEPQWGLVAWSSVASLEQIGSHFYRLISLAALPHRLDIEDSSPESLNHRRPWSQISILYVPYVGDQETALGWTSCYRRLQSKLSLFYSRWAVIGWNLYLWCPYLCIGTNERW